MNLLKRNSYSNLRKELGDVKITLMYDKIKVAEQVETAEGVKFVLQEDLTDFVVPYFFRNTNEATLEALTEWVMHRVPPKDRSDIKELLKEWSLEKYSILSVAFQTRASVIGDGWWIQVHETDTYEKNTLRGITGELPISFE